MLRRVSSGINLTSTSRHMNFLRRDLCKSSRLIPSPFPINVEGFPNRNVRTPFSQSMAHYCTSPSSDPPLYKPKKEKKDESSVHKKAEEEKVGAAPPPPPGGGAPPPPPPPNEDPNKKEESDEENAKKSEKTNANEEKEKQTEKDADKEDTKKTTSGQIFAALKKMEENDPSGWKTFTACMAAIFFGLTVPYYVLTSSKTTKIDIQQLKQQLIATGKVEKIRIDCKAELAFVYLKGIKEPEYHIQIGNDFAAFERQLEGTEIELGLPETLLQYDWNEFDIKSFCISVGYVAGLSVLLYFLILRPAVKMGMSGSGSSFFKMPGASPAKEFKPEKGVKKTTFDDVAGLDEAKVEIMEFVDFLSNPAKYKKLGAKIPKGALLVGPPGTGKTLLAKATAGVSGVPFFSTSGSDFVEMFVGVGPSRVRALFAEARKKKPCIIWIDEIDAIGKARSSGKMGGNDERENTLNQLLVEMDGFETNDGVVVLAGTNRQDTLDSALLRPGRFDRQIAISNPDISARKEIFQLHLKSLSLAAQCADSFDNFAGRLAAMTPGFSGADIANACNEAALIAARGNKSSVDVKDFEAAIERVIGGIEKKSKVLAKDEKRTVAYHEAGHAVTSWFLEHASPLLKVSIVPRGSAALGYAQYLPRDRFLQTTDQLNDVMAVALGGRVAEALTFGKITTGAQDDLDKVTKSAYDQVINYGMNENVGHLSYGQFTKGNRFAPRPYSDLTAETIDSEVRKMVDAAYQRTESILLKHRDGLESVAQLLLEKEVISQEQVRSILGARPFPEPEDKAEQYYKGFSVLDPGEDNPTSDSTLVEPTNDSSEPIEETKEETPPAPEDKPLPSA